MCRQMPVLAHMWNRTTHGSWFSSSTMGVSGTKLRPSDLYHVYHQSQLTSLQIVFLFVSMLNHLVSIGMGSHVQTLGEGLHE